MAAVVRHDAKEKNESRSRMGICLFVRNSDDARDAKCARDWSGSTRKRMDGTTTEWEAVSLFFPVVMLVRVAAAGAAEAYLNPGAGK